MIDLNNLNNNIIQSIDDVQDWLIELALDKSLFDSIFTAAFANNRDTVKTASLHSPITNKNFQDFSLLELENSQDSHRINVAFPLDRKKIDIAEEFINLDTHNFEGNFSNLVGEIDLSVPEDLVTLDTFTGDVKKKVYTFGDDDRVLVGDNDWDQRIAFITAEFPDGSHTGFTGALISPFHILTVAHGIYGKDKGGFAYTDSIKVSLGQHGTERYYGTANAVTYSYFTGYTDDSNWRLVDGEWRPQSFNHDMAIITLDFNLGNSTGWFDYKFNNSNSYFQDLIVNSAGYPSDLAKSWSWSNSRVANVDLYHVGGPITEVYAETFRYELDSAGGQSGSPVWTYNDTTQERFIVGVHSFGSISSNGAARITAGKFNKIQNLIAGEQLSIQPLDQPDFLDHDEWFGTDLAYFKNNSTGELVDDLSSSILSVGAGDSITFHSVISNNGTSKFGDSLHFLEPTIEVSFYASTDNQINDSDYKIGDVSISAIDSFKWRDVSLTTAFPQIPEGFYYLGYTFDSVMSEFNLNNNQGLIDGSLIQVDNFNLVSSADVDIL